MQRRRISKHRKNNRYTVRKRPIHSVIWSFIVSIFAAVGRPFYLASSFSLLYFTVFFGIGVPNFILRFARALKWLFTRIAEKTRFKQTSKPKKAGLTARERFSYLFNPLFAPLRVLVSATPVLFFIGVSFAFFVTFSSTFLYFYVLKDLPSPRELVTRVPIVSTKIYDRNGNLLYEIYKDEKRTLVPLSSIPDELKQATISIEDKDFYSHSGFSIPGIARAVLADVKQQRVQGGSTITQQLIKNTLLSPEKTFRRKMREVILAVMVETKLSKDEILEMYFNEVSYGGSIYGAEQASRRFFGKSVSRLTLAESAYLAGIPQAPSTYSPYGPNPELGFNRMSQVLHRMVEDEYITQQQADAAREEELQFQPDVTNIKAPHFVMYIKDLLAQEYGEDVVSQGGLEVYTTLDYELQKKAEEAIELELMKIQRFRVSNGAAMVTNPKNGAILAMVGSRNYFDTKNDGQVNVTLRERQPGSSIKPLTYATAFEKGMTPATVIADSPITYRIVGSPPYTPKNYDGRHRGRVTIRQALGSSYNIPAVKTLASIGVPAVIDKGRQLGLTSWGEAAASRFGLSLTLGGGEVKMTDMTQLYGTFANGGLTVPLNPILQVKDYKGKVIYSNPCTDDNDVCGSNRVLDPRIAYQITDILADNGARAPAFGTNSILNIPSQQVAVKTGTTNNLRDNWTFGYTTNRLVGTWVGNNDNTPMSNVVSGITGASPIWNTIMKSLLDENSPHTFAEPGNLVKVRICVPTGTLPCSACKYIREETFIPGTEPKIACRDEQFASPSPVASPESGERDQILDGASR